MKKKVYESFCARAAQKGKQQEKHGGTMQHGIRMKQILAYCLDMDGTWNTDFKCVFIFDGLLR